MNYRDTITCSGTIYVYGNDSTIGEVLIQLSDTSSPLKKDVYTVLANGAYKDGMLYAKDGVVYAKCNIECGPDKSFGQAIASAYADALRRYEALCQRVQDAEFVYRVRDVLDGKGG